MQAAAFSFTLTLKLHAKVFTTELRLRTPGGSYYIIINDILGMARPLALLGMSRGQLWVWALGIMRLRLLWLQRQFH